MCLGCICLPVAVSSSRRRLYASGYKQSHMRHVWDRLGAPVWRIDVGQAAAENKALVRGTVRTRCLQSQCSVLSCDITQVCMYSCTHFLPICAVPYTCFVRCQRFDFSILARTRVVFRISKPCRISLAASLCAPASTASAHGSRRSGLTWTWSLVGSVHCGAESLRAALESRCGQDLTTGLLRLKNTNQAAYQLALRRLDRFHGADLMNTHQSRVERAEGRQRVAVLRRPAANAGEGRPDGLPNDQQAANGS